MSLYLRFVKARHHQLLLPLVVAVLLPGTAQSLFAQEELVDHEQHHPELESSSTLTGISAVQETHGLHSDKSSA
tara:strand:+ start:969 stop:1190 length:222 start_codon:yes stop_codon:yes gene_type:complete